MGFSQRLIDGSGYAAEGFAQAYDEFRPSPAPAVLSILTMQAGAARQGPPMDPRHWDAQLLASDSATQLAQFGDEGGSAIEAFEGTFGSLTRTACLPSTTITSMLW